MSGVWRLDFKTWEIALGTWRPIVRTTVFGRERIVRQSNMRYLMPDIKKASKRWNQHEE